MIGGSTTQLPSLALTFLGLLLLKISLFLFLKGKMCANIVLLCIIWNKYLFQSKICLFCNLGLIFVIVTFILFSFLFIYFCLPSM